MSITQQTQGQHGAVSKSTALVLILMPIIIMIIIGALNNNFSSSGISGTPSLTCDPTIFLCSDTGTHGCQAITCQFSAVSFLTQSSPFTRLTQGDIFAFFTGIGTSQPISSQNPFTIAGLSASTAIYANCELLFKNTLLNIWRGCSQTNTAGNNITQANTFSWPTGLNKGNGSLLHFFNLQVSNKSQYSSNWKQAQSSMCYVSIAIFSIASPSFVEEVYWSCQYYQVLNSQNHLAHHGDTGNHTNYWYYWLGINGTNYKNLGGGCFYNANCSNGTLAHASVEIEAVNWDDWACGKQVQQPNGYAAGASLGGGVTDPLAIPAQTEECKNFYNSLAQYSKATNNPNINSLPLQWFFMGGVAIFLLGSGLFFNVQGTVFGTGGGIGGGSNPQGTKLGQVIGIGLIVWPVVLSEFGTWITGTYLPLGLDIILGFVLTGSFFFGLYERL